MLSETLLNTYELMCVACGERLIAPTVDEQLIVQSQQSN